MIDSIARTFLALHDNPHYNSCNFAYNAYTIHTMQTMYYICIQINKIHLTNEFELVPLSGSSNLLKLI